MTNKKLIRVLVLFSMLFLSLIVYLTYMELFQNDKIASNPYNRRQWDYEEDTVRGSICDVNGEILAYSEEQLRIYPYNNLYSHVIGYNSKIYGRSMLEAAYNDRLLGKNSVTEVIGTGSAARGDTVYLTIDHTLQQTAYDSLGSANGCAIAINPKTGAVLAMVSKPDFNPNSDALTAAWTDLTEDETSPLLPRATSGLYAPGSTFKLVTALCALQKGYGGDVFDDRGKTEIGGKIFENQQTKSYGTIDLTTALAVSSNVAFCELGARLGAGPLRSAAEAFGFNKQLKFDVPVSVSSFPTGQADDAEAAALAIGQGSMLATPLQMALVTCGIANGGTVMQPYLVDRIESAVLGRSERTTPKALYKAASAENAAAVGEMMREAVRRGTAVNSSISGIAVAGKTGTAENERLEDGKGQEHTWFVGYAPADDPQIAVCVMMEYSGGSGGGNCAPAARAIMQRHLTQ